MGFNSGFKGLILLVMWLFSLQGHCQGSCHFPSSRWVSCGLNWRPVRVVGKFWRSCLLKDSRDEFLFLEEPHQSAKPRNTKPRNRGISLYPSSTNHPVAHIIKTLKYIIFFTVYFFTFFFFEFYFRLKNVPTMCGEATLQCRTAVSRRAQCNVGSYPMHSP